MEKSRAIELLEHLAWDRDIDRNPYGNALNIAIDALKAQLSQEGTTSDLISRQAAIDLVTDMEFMNFTAKGILRDSLRKLSPAQPEPQEGHWIDKGWDGDWAWQIDGRGNCWRVIECSECGKRVLVESNYCPNCGAHMKGATP